MARPVRPALDPMEAVLALERRVAVLERLRAAAPVLAADPDTPQPGDHWVVGTQWRYCDAAGAVRALTGA